MTLSLLYAGIARYMTYPDIGAGKIVFSYDGDIWIVSEKGGKARRLTSYPGEETNPKISPDGKWVAFLGSYQGLRAVYLISTQGGLPKRLTYHQGRTRIIGWTPDNKGVIISSDFELFTYWESKAYVVDLNGGYPKALPLPRAVFLSFSPDGKRIAYNDRGRPEYYWHRYKGGQYTRIWVAEPSRRSYRLITKYVGKNAYPLWIGKRIYFMSDRWEGVRNLFSIDPDNPRDVRRHTSFKSDIAYLSSGDGKIVFVEKGEIWTYEPSTDTLKKITVEVSDDYWKLTPKDINPKKYIHYVDVDNAGERTLIEARGDIFLMDNKTSEAINLTKTPGAREMYPVFSPDGKKIAYFSDISGEYQLYTMDIATGKVRQITRTLKTYPYHPEWSPDGNWMVFSTKDLEIYLVNMKTGDLKLIDKNKYLKNDEFSWEMSDYSWSPDSQWIAFSKTAFNRNNVIYLYNVKTGQKRAITRDFFDNYNPTFSKDGKYLYFLSNRNFDVLVDYLEDNHIVQHPTKIMVVQLRAGERPPFYKESLREKIKKKEAKEGEKSGKKAEKKTVNVRVDFNGIEQRIFEVPVKPGNYFFLQAGDGKLVYLSLPYITMNDYDYFFVRPLFPHYFLNIYDPKKKKSAKLGKIAFYHLSLNGKHLSAMAGEKVYSQGLGKLFSSGKLSGELNLSKLTYHLDYRAEWRQIFLEAWRLYRDFFYDPHMHGMDWEAEKKLVSRIIPYVTSRNQLNWILINMAGSLCVSHSYIFGGDVTMGVKIERKAAFPGSLGADFTFKNGYPVFKKIYPGRPWEKGHEAPLFRPDIKVKEGDYLLAINGVDLKGKNPLKYLQVHPGQTVEITVNSVPSYKGARTYIVKPLTYDKTIRYDYWVDTNEKLVLRKTNGQVGYMHIRDMMQRGLADFEKYFRAYRYKKALIIDARYNAGGYDEYMMIDKLERKLVAFSRVRNFQPMLYPGAVHPGPKILLVNENCGSDGEAFTHHFKVRKLGIVIGVPTWGGLVGIINPIRTIDNGIIYQSNVGFYDAETGKWIVENHGEDPDIYLDQDPIDLLEGRDTQLEKAIKVALEEIKKHPVKFIKPPAYPEKSKGFPKEK